MRRGWSRARSTVKENLLTPGEATPALLFCRRRLAGTGAQGRTRGERARAHAEARAKRRRDVAHGIAAAGAEAFDAERASGVGAEPLAASFAQRIDALHGEARHVLHRDFPQRLAPLATLAERRGRDCSITSVMARIVAQGRCGVKRKYHKILGWSCSPGMIHSMPKVWRKRGGWYG